MKNTQIGNKDSKQIINQKLEQHVLNSKAKTKITLEKGKSATTFQGGMEVPIMFKEILPGEYIHEWNIQNITRILTPLVPTLDRIYLTIKAFFVPHTRVWKEAEKKLAGKIDADQQSTLEEANLPFATINNATTKHSYFKTHLANKYGVPNHSSTTNINLLLLRGYRAIENDFLRVKEYEPSKIEWNETHATETENKALNWCDYESMPEAPENIANYGYMLAPAKARKSYLTNIKKNMYDTESHYDFLNQENPNELYRHLDWQTQFNDQKQRAANAEKNDWDIIAEMGGTSPVINDRVQLLGVMDYELNYQQITQSAPEIDGSSPLGTTGSFSYTKVNGTLFSHKEFKQHGYIHILINLNVDSKVDGGIPKELLKIDINDIYRPGLAEKEEQILIDKELSAKYGSSKMIAFQPPWAEYKRLPTIISGEMQNTTLLNDPITNTPNISNSQWHNLIESDFSIINMHWLRPAYYVNKVLERNNILQQVSQEENNPARIYFNIHFHEDPIINMGEHQVITSLPIKSQDINQIDKAEESR